MTLPRWLTAPPDWADELDFTGPRVRAARWAWLLLMAGLLSVVAVMPMVREADEALLEAQEAVRRLERAAHQQALLEKTMARQAQGAGSSGTSSGLAPQACLQAARLARLLAYPWMPLMSQVEAAAQAGHTVLLSMRVDLNGMDHRAASVPDVRLAAAVRDDDEALRWVQTHGAAAQLLSRQRLSAPLMTATGSYPWRVEASVPGGSP